VDGGKVYSTYMMWSDMKNNHNKYYIVQVLKRKGTEQYSTWIRYGRVGMVADKFLNGNNKQGALSTYIKKTNEKLRKGYTEIKMALGASDADGAAGGSTTKSTKCDVVIDDS
jgi:predicted DNA-binding WGR domain protein